MNVRQKSLWRSKNLNRHFRKRANQRAAKERKRLARVAREEPYPDTSSSYTPTRKPGGFRVTIECLEDGERVSFTSRWTPFGHEELSISPTLAGRKVAAIMANYRAIRA